MIQIVANKFFISRVQKKRKYNLVYKDVYFDELDFSKKKTILGIKRKVSKEVSYVLTAKKILSENKSIRLFTWEDFEKLIAELLLIDGWHVYHTKSRRDGGIDIIATKNFDKIGYFKILWQVKRYGVSRSVGVDIVREFGYIVIKDGASKGVIVSTGRFTRGALKLIKENEYTLSCLGYDEIEKWIAGRDNFNVANYSADDLPF